MRYLMPALLVIGGMLCGGNEAQAGIGPGWRGWSWYAGQNRPTAPYAGSYYRERGFVPQMKYSDYDRGVHVPPVR